MESIGPAYQKVADDIKGKITSGELEVGDAIPSTSKLQEQYDLSSTVIRRAIRLLQDEGIVQGHSGKGVYVRATPKTAAEERKSVSSLSRQVDDLQAEVGRLNGKVARLQAHLKDLCARLGQPYPDDDASAEPARPRQRKTGS